MAELLHLPLFFCCATALYLGQSTHTSCPFCFLSLLSNMNCLPECWSCFCSSPSLLQSVFAAHLMCCLWISSKQTKFFSNAMHQNNLIKILFPPPNMKVRSLISVAATSSYLWLLLLLRSISY